MAAATAIQIRLAGNQDTALKPALAVRQKTVHAEETVPAIMALVAVFKAAMDYAMLICRLPISGMK